MSIEQNENTGITLELRLVRDHEAQCPCVLPQGYTIENNELNPVSIPYALIDEMRLVVGELEGTLPDLTDDRFLEKAANLFELYTELLKVRRVAFDEVKKKRTEIKNEKGSFEKGAIRIITKRKEDER